MCGETRLPAWMGHACISYTGPFGHVISREPPDFKDGSLHERERGDVSRQGDVVNEAVGKNAFTGKEYRVGIMVLSKGDMGAGHEVASTTSINQGIEPKPLRVFLQVVVCSIHLSRRILYGGGLHQKDHNRLQGWCVRIAC